MRGYKKAGKLTLPVYVDGDNNNYILSIGRHGEKVLTPIIPQDGSYHMLHNQAIVVDSVSAYMNGNGNGASHRAPTIQVPVVLPTSGG